MSPGTLTASGYRYVVLETQRLPIYADQCARAVMQSHVSQVTLPIWPHPSILCHMFGIS